jgi:hypothetical protein
LDENGDLLPPRMKTFDINLTGVIYTVKLAIFYIKQSHTGGSIALTASVSSFTCFGPTDYTTAKHGVYGILRAMHENLYPNLPVRINAVAPSWTETGVVPKELIAVIGQENVQSPDVVARSVICLMADQGRHGQMIHSEKGIFRELENGENGYVFLGQRHDNACSNQSTRQHKCLLIRYVQIPRPYEENVGRP